MLDDTADLAPPAAAATITRDAAALALVAPGGFYVIDDLLPQAGWPVDHALRVAALRDDLAARRDFVRAALAWAIGIALMVRKP